MNKDIICRLCYEIILDDNFKRLDGDVLNMLEILPLTLNGSIIEDGLVCLECNDNLKVLFDFKTLVLCNNDYLKTYMGPWQNVKLNLEEVIVKKNTVGIKCEDESVCRFCLDYFDRSLMMELKNINMFLNDMLGKCLPEIDLNIVENSLMCNNCVEILENQFKFMTKCLNSDNFCSKEEKITWNDTFELENKSESITIDSHDIKIEKINDIAVDSVNLRTEDSEDIEDFDLKIEDSFNEDQDCKEIKRESNISNASEDFIELSTTSKLEVPYTCTICAYQTNRLQTLNQHYLVHQDPSVAKLYKCDVCNYATKQKSTMKVHSLMHADPSEVTMKKCIECSFQSPYIDKLRKHLEKEHSNKINFQKYKCMDCLYETTERCKLQRHYKNSHRKDIKLDIINFRCLKCIYYGKSKEDISRHHREVHFLRHQCEYCDYITNKMCLLNAHKMTHKSNEKVKTYSCHECDLKTRNKNGLVIHFKIHRKWEEIRRKINEYKYEEVV